MACTDAPPGGRVTSDAWAVLVKSAIGTRAPNPTAVLFTEDTPSGQFVLGSLAAGAKSAGFSVVSAASSLPVPAGGDYAPLAASAVRANAGAPPDAVFVSGSYSNVVGMKRALAGAGFSGLFTDAIEYDPELVAAASGSWVFVQSAAVEASATNPAMQQLVTDVRAQSPDVAIDQSVLAGYWSADLFVEALRRAGRNLTVTRLLRAANRSFTYRVPDTVGPVTFPAAHDAPTPCGTLVESDGAAFAVQAPYTCGKVVRVRQ